jgi:hypothetical protein
MKKRDDYPRPTGGNEVAVSKGCAPIFVIIGSVIPIGNFVAGAFV